MILRVAKSVLNALYRIMQMNDIFAASLCIQNSHNGHFPSDHLRNGPYFVHVCADFQVEERNRIPLTTTLGKRLLTAPMHH